MSKERLFEEILICARGGGKGPVVRSYAAGYTHLCPNCQSVVYSDGIKPGMQMIYECEDCSHKFIAKVGKYRNIPGEKISKFTKVKIF